MLYFYFDGQKEPGLKIKFSDLFSGKVYPFTKPVCGNEIGGFYCYLPITYKKSCKIVFDGPKLEFIQIQYRNLPEKKVETYTGEFSQQTTVPIFLPISLTMHSLMASHLPSSFSSSSRSEEHTSEL